MRITMVGTGYVGLASGACFADFGHHVVCVDNNADKIAALRGGAIPIFEPDLDRMVEANVAARRLVFSADFGRAVRNSDAVFIAVGTPSRRGDGHADLSYVHAAAREIAGSLRKFAVVINKSTVPVGTGDEVERIIRETNPSADVAVASNPEFLREGSAIRDFKHPDRIVVGTEDDRARKVLADIYRPLYLNQAPLMFTDRRTAELIKYAANAFLANQDRLHQRNRGSRREGRGRHPGGRPRHRPRQPHRRQIPAPRVIVGNSIRLVSGVELGDALG